MLARKMAAAPLDWFCRPVADSASATDTAFGAYTPCALDSVVGNVSHLALVGLCLYRIWLIKSKPKLQRFYLKSSFFNYVLAFLAIFCAAEPLFRLVKSISAFNISEDKVLAPFEMVNLGIEFISWCSLVFLLLFETRIYVKEFRWYIRFGMIYVLVGDVVMFNFIQPVQTLDARSFLFIGSVLVQILLGILLLFYVPQLDSYPGYIPLSDSLDNTKDEKPLGEDVCPERHASIFSGIYFNWMTPLMQRGYRKPITEKEVWRLDSWDQSETLSKKFVPGWMSSHAFIGLSSSLNPYPFNFHRFQISWVEETQRQKPWLLRALNRSLGGRYKFDVDFAESLSNESLSITCTNSENG